MTATGFNLSVMGDIAFTVVEEPIDFGNTFTYRGIVSSGVPNMAAMTRRPWIDEQEFNPGYLQRAIHLLPKQGDHEPWEFNSDYYLERDQLPTVDLEDGSLRFEAATGLRASSQ